MILAKKVRLLPTEEQEQQLWKAAGTARFITVHLIYKNCKKNRKTIKRL